METKTTSILPFEQPTQPVKNNKKKVMIIILVVILLVISAIGTYLFMQQEGTDSSKTDDNAGENTDSDSDDEDSNEDTDDEDEDTEEDDDSQGEEPNEEPPIILDTIKEGDTLGNVVEITGKSKLWLYEAEARVEVFDEDDKFVGWGIMTATDENWMTEEYVNFKAELTILNGASTEGKLVFIKNNPSGDEELDDTFEVDVKFEKQDIIINDVEALTSIRKNQLIEGSAKGFFFEASFPIFIQDLSNPDISEGILAMATEDWMQDDYVEFEANIEDVLRSGSRAKIIFQKDNPSGLPENDKSYVFNTFVR